MVCGIIMGANGQVQCVYTSTAGSVGIIMGISTRGGICHTIPYIAVAGRSRIAVVGTMVKGKIECHRAVATGQIGGSMCRGIGCGIVCETIPVDAVTGND